MSTSGLSQWKFKSDIGDLYLVASTLGLTRVFWSEQSGVPYLKSFSSDSPQSKILKQCVDEITDYLAGKRYFFEIPIDANGTEFQMKVWKELRKIKYGKTKSYKEVAHALDSEAIRAVGTANGKNPLCIVIPCHRVISSNGTLGGYSGGLEKKKFLLDLESKRSKKS